MALEGVAWDCLSVETVIRDLELVHLDVFQRLVITPSEAADNDRAYTDSSEEAPNTTATSWRKWWPKAMLKYWTKVYF